MATTYPDPTIDEYLRKRLMPVEGAIPRLAGIEMYGNSIPAGTVGGDLFEYINFQQRYDDPIPSFGTKLSMIFAKERGRVYVEEQAHRGADDRCAEASRGGASRRGCGARSGSF